jgi:hypothetical protein
MIQPNRTERSPDAQRMPNTPVSGGEAAPPHRRREWNPAWGWALFALVVLVAMGIAILFGGNQDYS